MKLFTGETVLEAARKRVAFLFDEFEHIYVAFSGGKDSTTVLHLCLEEARVRDRLPVKVVFVDQEAEWRSTIEYVRAVMDRPDVDPVWLQCPIKISNSASVDEAAEWLNCWEPGGEWMRDREPDSIHENIFGTDRFKDMFDHILSTFHPDEKACLIGGVRAEESPARRQGLTTRAKYKGVTWAKRLSGFHDHYTFYPIWDWTYKDVWKFIHDGGHAYCRIYDYMWQHGVAPFNMRVSNLHHETAVKSLYYMQEVEQDTWDKLTARLGGVHVARNLGHEHQFSAPKKLPWMFRTWVEYRDHLLENLINNEDHKAKYRAAFAQYDDAFEGMVKPERLWKAQIVTILANDFHLTKLENWASTPQAGEFVKWKRGKPIKARFGEWIPPDELAKAPKASSNA
jgi:predicted phosphoadenosine phosphosulfate sulfurtransferase